MGSRNVEPTLLRLYTIHITGSPGDTLFRVNGVFIYRVIVWGNKKKEKR